MDTGTEQIEQKTDPDPVNRALHGRFETDFLGWKVMVMRSSMTIMVSVTALAQRLRRQRARVISELIAISSEYVLQSDEWICEYDAVIYLHRTGRKDSERLIAQVHGAAKFARSEVLQQIKDVRADEWKLLQDIRAVQSRTDLTQSEADALLTRARALHDRAKALSDTESIALSLLLGLMGNSPGLPN